MEEGRLPPFAPHFTWPGAPGSSAMSKTAYMRGLQVFISDIRACQNKEQEQRRVEKELAKIRARFGEDKALSGYDRRKYIWKLLYIFMLGYEIDFGHKQACDLIPMPKYSDKQVGYMACSLLLKENDEFLRLAINGIHNDLISRNEAFQALALSFVGNIGGQEMAEALMQDVLKLLTAGSSRPIIKKRATLCLLRLLRKTPADAPLLVSADNFSPTMGALLEERDLGLLLCSVTLLQGIILRTGPAGYETCQGRLILILERLIRERERIPPEYLYYGIPSPWLQARCLRCLQTFAAPPDAPAERKALHDVLQATVATMTAEVAKNANPNKSNALNAVLFEAVALAMHHAQLGALPPAGAGGQDPLSMASCLTLLGRYLGGRDPNAKYLALDALARTASGVPEVLEGIRHVQPTVMANLKDPDVSIRRRSLDLLFALCDAASAPDIVAELLKYLTVADFGSREELVLKIAILAEKFAPSMQWYVDVVLQLLERSGDFVGDDIWHRSVQLVTNNPSMHAYAARNVAEALKRGAAHESLVCTAAYILGEYGRLIASEVPPAEQFRLLHGAFAAASPAAKGLLMTALLKIFLLDPHNAAMAREVRSLFERYKRFMDAELQQRATEYLALAHNPQAATSTFILPMPKWEVRESSLLKRLQQAEGGAEDGQQQQQLTLSNMPSTLSTAGTSPLLSVPVPGGAPAQRPAGAPDLLSMDSHTSSTNGLAPMGSGAGNGSAAVGPAPYGQQPPAMAPAPPPQPANAVDLLSDLFSDVVVQPPAAVHGAAPAPPPQQPQPPAPYGGQQYGAPYPAAFGPGAGAGAAFPTTSTFGAPYPAAVAPPPPMAGQYGQPAYFGAAQPPPPAPVANPFAAAAAPAPAPVANPFALAPPAAPAAPVAAAPPAYTTAPQPPPAALQPPPPAAAAGGFGADPFGDSGFAPAPPAVEPPRPTADVESWHAALLLKERGILYEDQYLQVGLQSQYTRGRGQLMLYWGNKMTAATLTGVSVTLAPLPSGVAATVTAIPGTLAPKQQVPMQVSLTAMGPFTDPPVLVVSYQVNGAPALNALQLKLPVAMHKFMQPDPTIDKDFFFTQWKAYQQPPSKVQEMVERPATAAPLPSEVVVGLMRALHLGVEHGYLDPSPHNEAGAGYWACGPAEKPFICCCRVEANPQNRGQFRVTVVSPQPELAAAVHALLVAQIRAATA